MPIPDIAPIQNPYGPLITFKTEDILPPSAIYVGPQDTIVIQSVTPTVGATIVIAYRLLRPDGLIVATVDLFSFLAGGGWDAWLAIKPSEGFLLSMTIFSNAPRGQVFVRAFLSNDNTDTQVGTPSHTFCQGYATGPGVLTFPQQSIQSSFDGQGWVHDVAQGTATGVPVLWTVPANVHWRIRQVTFLFVTSAVVANRNLYVHLLSDLGHTVGWYPFPTPCPASATNFLTAASGASSQSLSSVQTIGLPTDLDFPPNWQVQLTASSLDAADQFQSPVLTVEEFVGA